VFKSVNLLRLDHGQEVLSELTSYCKRKGISSAIILGIIGSLEKARLGTPATDGKWHAQQNDYSGHMSILSGQGSLSTYKGEKIFHVHMALIDPARPEMMIGGHLEEGIVWATTEIYIGELTYQLQRTFDEKLNAPMLTTT
jgi:predicted DNA-binding protein with PD1-like motif